MQKAQGAIQYLLMAGGAIIVAVILITLISGISKSGASDTNNSAEKLSEIIKDSKCQNLNDCPRDLNTGNGIEFGALEYSFSPEIFRPSMNLRPLSKDSAQLYLTKFSNHDFVRMSSIGYQLRNSSCFDGCANPFKTNLSTYLEGLDIENPAWGQIHKRIIFDFWGNPVWLQGANGKPDPEKWKPVAGEIATQLKGVTAVEIYLEVWNEPDLGEFWSGTTQEYLAIYKAIAEEIKSANPNAKVGGAAVNQWFNKLPGSENALNIELIRYASENNVPLDFVSWHFYRTPDQAKDPVEAYEAEISEAGFSKKPELIITEWNGWSTEARKYVPAMSSLIATDYFEFAQAGIDGQIFYNWEDDTSLDDPSNRYYGLLTRQGEETKDLRPTYYAHAMFDALAEKSSAIALTKKDSLLMVIGKPKTGNCSPAIMWEPNFDSSSPGFYANKDYEIPFESTGTITAQKPVSVKSEFKEKSVQIQGNTLSFSLEANEVLGLEICTQ